MKTRILVAHPTLAKSKANQALIKSARQLPSVEIVDLTALKGSGAFDVPSELAALRKCDLLVWQFPLYWYSAPAILREWQDQVLSAAVYGPEKVLQGKQLLVATTVGARASTYRAGDLNQYTMDELLRPFETCSRSAGMRWLPHFALYETDKLDEKGLQEAGEAYASLLSGVRD